MLRALRGLCTHVIVKRRNALLLRRVANGMAVREAIARSGETDPAVAAFYERLLASKGIGR